MDCGQKGCVVDFSLILEVTKRWGEGSFIAGAQSKLYMKQMNGASSNNHVKGKMSGKIQTFLGLHGQKASIKR